MNNWTKSSPPSRLLLTQVNYLLTLTEKIHHSLSISGLLHQKSAFPGLCADGWAAAAAPVPDWQQPQQLVVWSIAAVASRPDQF